jgi:F0F1-type ATP synthase membrane subunit b/b'
MVTFLIILGLLVAGAGVYYFLIKTGKIKDEDGDLIADVVEDKVEDIKEDVQEVVKKTKTRVKKVKAEVKEVIAEVEDVVSAIKGKPTKSKLNSLTKQQLVDAAKQDHGIELDGSVKKSTLVNKVYSIYNKPQK